MEEAQARPKVKRSYVRPLSSFTFSLRHRRRGMLMILSTALMVLSITFPVFLLSAMTSAMEPYLHYLQNVSVIHSTAQSELNPAIVSQLKRHPAAAYMIPAIPLAMRMVLPPGGTTDVFIFGVSESDLPVLIESFDMQLQQGRLPQSGRNEIVLSSAIAVNRGLKLTDHIGGEEESNDALVEDNIPVELEIVGILSPDLPWVGFASYEYLNAHELTSSRNLRWIVIPREGQKVALDSWLVENVDLTQARVIIHESELREYREMTASVVRVFALLECMIAAVAAIALAALNYIYYSQRKTEFGTLYAIGYSRSWLVRRTLKETGSVVCIAWVIGAMLCGIGLLIMHTFFYAPRGLTINIFGLMPWLLTLTIPLGVFLSSAGVVTRMLRTLDPVAIVERR